jgi:hypothetical protein
MRAGTGKRHPEMRHVIIVCAGTEVEGGAENACPAEPAWQAGMAT